MNIVLLNLPVHIATVMPYSLAKMRSVLISRLDENISALDLNAKYHRHFFPDLYSEKASGFFPSLDKFMKDTRAAYPKISKACLNGEFPEGHDFLMYKILGLVPDIVAISFIYNSQAFFSKGIIAELEKKGIKVIIGGPGDFSKVYGDAKVLPDYDSLSEYLWKNGAKKRFEIKAPVLDFSIFPKEDYFTKEIVYPLRTSLSCPYKLCSFCTHHGNLPYEQLSLAEVKEAIVKNKMKKIFFTDDDFPAERLKELAWMLKPLDVKWWCQLRPLKKIIPLLPLLKESGLISIAWGLESGSQRILDMIQKGTRINDIEDVLAASHKLGIRNMVYVMFGLPGETEETCLETMEFLKKNKSVIYLVSPTVFGLQQGSRIYSEPERFGVKKIILTERTFLSDKVEYEPIAGMTQEDAQDFKYRHIREIRKLNKMPDVIVLCKEQVLNWD